MVLFFLAVWRRPEITEICFLGLQRMMNLMKSEALAVISEDSMIPLCNKYGIRYCMHENLPLGRKKNYGLSEALKIEWDHLIELGSDDVFLNDAAKFYKDNLNNEYFGFNHIAFIDSLTGNCRQYKTSSVFGLGRAIRRDVVEQNFTDGTLWGDNLNRAMDKSSHYKIEVKGTKTKYKSIESPEPLAIDIKSKENLWQFNPTIGKPYDMEKLLRGVSEEEQGRILELIKHNQCIETQVIR